MRNINLRIRSINRSVVAMLMLTFAFTGCDYGSSWSPYKSKATLSGTVISYNTTTISGKTSGDPAYKWVLQVEQGGDFCTVVTQVGQVGTPFSLKFTTNEGETERRAEVRITFTDGYTQTFIIRQLAKTENPSFDRAWAEQPEFQQGASLIYKTYYTTLANGDYVRNFSVCYDTDKLCSRWVAYPAHNIYTSGRNYQTGSTTAGRTNAWAFDDSVTQYKADSNYNKAYEILSKYNSAKDTYDTYTNPIIPQSKQADIRFTNGFGSGWARGHMLPSATRYSTWNTNAQTCYATNIMVQEYNFNGGSWATLENNTREKICPDTLFVVVGTLFEDNKTVNRFNRTIRVPSHCFKLLLRTKKGNSGKNISDITSADDLMCIGFVYENSRNSENATMSSAAVSVAEIERRSGFTFFRNINPAIADKVKQQCNYNDWKF